MRSSTSEHVSGGGRSEDTEARGTATAAGADDADDEDGADDGDAADTASEIDDILCTDEDEDNADGIAATAVPSC